MGPFSLTPILLTVMLSLWGLSSGCSWPTEHPILGEVDAGLFEVLSTSPGDGEGGVELLPEIRVTLSRPPDLDSLTAETLSLSSGRITIPCNRSGEGRDLLLLPVEPLEEGLRYDVSLSKELLSDLGTRLEPYSFSFYTTSSIDGGAGD